MKAKAKVVKQMGAQGDVLFRRVQAMPSGVTEVQRENGALLVAHSETGHHHTVSTSGVQMFAHPTDPFVRYLRIPPKTQLKDTVDVVHHRPWDTHATLRLLGDSDGETIYEIRRQREHTPEGWRRVED